MITFLGARASMGNHDPVKAIDIADGMKLRMDSPHESRRRLIREIAKYARQTLLPYMGMDELLVADLSGYRLTDDQQVINEYLKQCRIGGLSKLKSANEAKRTTAAVVASGQPLLFGDSLDSGDHTDKGSESSIPQDQLRWA